MRATGGRRDPGWLLPALIALSLLLAGCSIFTGSVPADHTHEPGTEDGDHTHEPGTEGDPGAEGASGVDHHGNPIYEEDERVYETVTADGVTVEFTIENFIGVGGRGGEVAPRLVEGEHANLQFHVTDAGTGAPLGGLAPAAWVDVAGGDADCSARVAGYRSGSLDQRPKIDLNSYFILAMNKDNTISVLDPTIDVAGMTNLFSVILLQADPGDWAMDPDGSRLFVTLPSLDKVAVIDLQGFMVEDHVDLPGTPARIAMDPDGARAWVSLAGGAGLAVIDAGTLAVARRDGAVTTAVAFSDDGRALVGRPGGATLLDADTLAEVGRVDLPGTPASIAVGPGGSAYVAQPDAGLVSVLGADGTERARIVTDPGVAQVAVSADGRWAIAAAPRADAVYVIETARDRITHVLPVKGSPDLVTFSQTAAYVHTSGSPSVTLIPLAEIDPTGDASVLTIPIGDRPSGSTGAPTTTGSMAATPDGTALLLPNPADDTVYFYTEGSQTALGGFQGHTLQPRAVQVVDRSLREPSPGVYTGSIRIPQGKDFVVAFQLSEPKLTHCFEFSARAAEQSLNDPAARPEIEVLTADGPLTAGSPTAYRFRLVTTDGRPIPGLTDLSALAVGTATGWKERFPAAQVGDGVYEIVLRLPDPGYYQLFFAAPSFGLGYADLPSRSVRVVAG